MPKLTEKTKARRKLILKWRRFLGLCVSCGAEAYGNSLCDRCQDRQNEHHRALRERRKGKNLCRECGKVEVKAGQWRCDACVIKKFGENVCNTDGCNNIVGRNKRLCNDCLEAIEAARQVCNVYFNICSHCNCLFTAKNPLEKYCSPEHQREARLVKPINRICDICKEEYEFHRGINYDNVCSEECYKERHKIERRINKQRRRVRGAKYKERVTLTALYVRDGGRCQLMCGRKLNLKREVPHPMAATIDHIIPISKGGEHSYKNTQLACFECNCKKGNRGIPGGEQLRMFG